MTKCDETLSRSVRWKRIQAGVSAAALSREIGYSPSYISKLESGEHDPSFTAFARLVKVLGFTDQEILFTVKKAGEET